MRQGFTHDCRHRKGKQDENSAKEGGVIRAARLRYIKTSPDDFGMSAYAPASPTPPHARRLLI